MYQLDIMKHDFQISPTIVQLHTFAPDIECLVSLNDLICNFEEGEISFIESLIIPSKTHDLNTFGYISCSTYIYPTAFRVAWSRLPTSKRLDYLFETFNHLLQ